MTDIRTQLAETMAVHGATHVLDVDACNGCAWRGRDWRDSHSDHLVDVLLALQGIAIVQVPDDPPRVTEWPAGAETVFHTPDDEIAATSIVFPITGAGEAQLVYTKTPKLLAAALLAAAAAAERGAE